MVERARFCGRCDGDLRGDWLTVALAIVAAAAKFNKFNKFNKFERREKKVQKKLRFRVLLYNARLTHA